MNPGKIVVLLAALALTACATTAPPPEERDPRDPWEPYNRNMYAFNRGLDKAIVRPIARGYTAIMPDPIETGLTNVFENLLGLQKMINLTLQGRPADTVQMAARFTMNTIFGLAGFFDVASKTGLPEYDEDFGQTLAVWGWEDSRYFVLPLLGPSTVRDGLGEFPDSYSNIVWRRAVSGRPYLLAVDIIQTRANFLPREAQLEEAFDEYLFVRDAWLQRRDFKIKGESTTPDYDSFLDDEDWDEDADG
ncbi:MAG: VacJ family lipoprotein [Wenzhouxiangellaceae bacterium]|nr:VacJ family lipoprotein [Wenzhouxiangellaceae bacterium]